MSAQSLLKELDIRFVDDICRRLVITETPRSDVKVYELISIREHSESPINIEEFEKLYPELGAKARLLRILEATNCGCCNSPWISDLTFEDLADFFKELEL